MPSQESLLDCPALESEGPPRQTGSLWLYAERRSFAPSCVSLHRIECPIWQWGHHRDSFNDLSRQTSDVSFGGFYARANDPRCGPAMINQHENPLPLD